MKILLAGVMQGNRRDGNIYSQNYRQEITAILSRHFTDVEVIDPDKTDPERLTYSHEQAAKMFFKYCKIAGEVDLVISFLPEASMGSACEMWQAHSNNIPIITISPLIHNWVVKLLSQKIYTSIEEFEIACTTGEVSIWLKGEKAIKVN